LIFRKRNLSCLPKSDLSLSSSGKSQPSFLKKSFFNSASAS
jgi:hypothetical protein